MKKFDFSITENWEFQGALFHYWPESEEWSEMAEDIIDSIYEANQSSSLTYFKPQDIFDKLDKESRYSIKGTCDHCGAAFNYGAVFKNKCSGEFCVVGHTCATTALCLSSSDYANKKLRKIVKQLRTRAKNDKIRAANNEIIESWKTDEPELYQWITFDHPISKDIKRYFLNNGEISTAQKKLLENLFTREEKKKEKVHYRGFIGKEKQRIEVPVKVVFATGFYRPAYMGDYDDYVYVIGMVTEKGQLLVSKTPSFGYKIEKGDALKIRATIKEHKEYDGDDQTIVQRIKVLTSDKAVVN